MHGQAGILGRLQNQRRVHHGNIQILPLAGPRLAVQGGGYSKGGVQGCRHVHRHEASSGGASFRMAIVRHHAGGRLYGAVIGGFAGLGPCLAIAGDAAIDEIRLDCRQGAIVQPQPGHGAGLEVLHHHIHACHQPLHQGSRLRRLEIQRHALLVEVHRQIGRRHVLVLRPPHQRPRLVAGARLLHLDNLRPQEPQLHDPKGPSKDLREIQDSHPAERLRHNPLQSPHTNPPAPPPATSALDLARLRWASLG